MLKRKLSLVSLLLSVIGLSACDPTGACAVSVELAPDGSGTMIVTSVSVPEKAAALEAGISGASVEARARLTRVKAQVAADANPAVFGIRFERRTDGLRVRVPRAEGRRWTSALAPTDGADSLQVEKVTGKKAPKVIRVEVKVPHEVSAHGVHPDLRDVSESVAYDKKTGVSTCAILLPVGLDTSDRDLVWDIMWRSR